MAERSRQSDLRNRVRQKHCPKVNADQYNAYTRFETIDSAVNQSAEWYLKLFFRKNRDISIIEYILLFGTYRCVRCVYFFK